MTIKSKTSSVSGMRTWQALQLVRSKNIWIGIGRTSPWPGETIESVGIPDIDLSIIRMDDLVMMKKARVVKLVAPDNNGTITVNGLKYREIMESEAVEKRTHMVYTSALIQFEEAPEMEYRQIGLFVDPILDPATPPGKLALQKSEIANPGILLAVNHRTRVPHDHQSEEEWKFISEF